MKAVKFILFFCLFTLAHSAIGQQAQVRGSVLDSDTGEPLIGATVRLEGSTYGGITDIDGQYSISVEQAGTYNLMASYIGYDGITVSSIEVKPGEVLPIDPLRLAIEGMALEQVVVIAEVKRNNEVAVLNLQKNASNLVDAISAEAIARTGDSDAAAVVKRIPGVTVEGGKYVYVRGLGDRYTKSVLNGLDIPGLDPERNTIQMDIFPSNIIENIVIHKSFTPDLPADFTGGMIDIKTKDFPAQKTFSLATSAGYNSITTFNNDFVLYEAERGDVFGFGGKARELPFPARYEPNRNDAFTLFSNTNALEKRVAVTPADALFNQNYSAALGNQIDGERFRFGYNLAATYKNDFDFKPDVQRNDVRVRPDSNAPGGLAYEVRQSRTGSIGSNEGLMSFLAGGSVKSGTDKIGLKLLHTRTGERTGSNRINTDDFNSQTALENDLDYTERSISNGILNGEHIVANKLRVDWANAFTYTEIDNPERTSSVFLLEGDQTVFTSGASSFSKEWQNMTEMNNSAKLDLGLPFQVGSGKKSMVKIGGAHSYKDRDYETLSVSLGKSAASFPGVVNNPNDALTRNFLFEGDNKEGFAITGVQADAENQYVSDMNVFAGYAMTELNLSDNLSLVGGFRVENAVMNYAGADRLTGDAIEDEVLNSTQILPSASANLNFMDDRMQLRTSFSKTLARPSFKEKSQIILYDPVQATFFYGNLDLVESEIQNYDLSWEFYPGGAEIISISPFYKNFKNPIEIQSLLGGSASDLQAVNKDEAKVYGVEFEARKNLAFITSGLANFAFGTNVSLAESEIALSPTELTKYTQTGVQAPENRELLGQSPYSLNAYLAYKDDLGDTEANIAYNVKGETLYIVGSNNNPNVYEDPFHKLDLKFSRRVGPNRTSKLSLKAGNLLNDNQELVYKFPGLENAVFNSYSEGISMSLGFSKKF